MAVRHGVTIESRVGAIDAELAASDEMMPGVVSLPHGYGHGLAGTRGEVASRHAGSVAMTLPMSSSWISCPATRRSTVFQCGSARPQPETLKAIDERKTHPHNQIDRGP
ncbi:MAG: hypothetical protein CM15mP103_04480 [Gammaproteobacteria bacterium]|nr:MAG: hypothetical protein CM15mP103_04480 [Gammaproteobacteria bacterium]